MSKRYKYEVVRPYEGYEYVVAQITIGSNRSNSLTGGFGRPLVPELFYQSSKHYANSKRARRREMADFMTRGYFVREIGE